MSRLLIPLALGAMALLASGCSGGRDSARGGSTDEMTSDTTSASSGTYLGATNKARKRAKEVTAEGEALRREQMKEAESFESRSTESSE